MKIPRLVLLCLLALASLSFAESPYEEELKELSSARAQAIEGATRLIDANFRNALVPLLKRAGAAGDVDSAVKIKAALDVLPMEAEKTLVGEWDLLTTTNYSSVITFYPKGKGKSSVEGPFTWKIIGRTLYVGDVEKAPDCYALPVKDGRLIGSNSHGNGITMTRKKAE